MKKFTAICLGVFMAAMFFIGCNSSTTVEIYTSSNVAIASFSLSKDDSIIANLDTVFFSIDLDKAKIFNADSLPYGTPVNKLVPKIVALDAISAATLTVTKANGTDTVFNYATNPEDTIDFTNPVILDVKSFDGAVSRSYTIKVNVHQLRPDTLVWDKAAMRKLPTNLSNVTRQRTARTSDGAYCLTMSVGRYCLAYTENPFNDDWSYITPDLPAGADVTSFTGTDDALYILAGDGLYTDMPLYTSTDGGRTWTDTGRRWTNIYGPMGEKLLGSRNTGSEWLAVQYPSEETAVIDPEMPVRRTSQTNYITMDLSQEGLAVIVGGRRANGTLTNATWAFDGSSWANISIASLPEPIEGMTVVPYFIFSVNTAYVATKHSILLAFGGTNGSTLNRKVFISYDLGMNWVDAPDSLQFPGDFPMVNGAQAYVFEATLGSRSAGNAWTRCELGYRIPSTVYILSPDATETAVYPVTTWECPYIYVFGGTLSDGYLSDTVWRAVINRLTFKPIV